MKFEFKLLSKKRVQKEPIQYPNPFELLKTNEKQKEIITSVPVSTDVFGRTLYQTPNGQFRAIGDMFNQLANIYQTQNNFVTLAPPPEDDEEDTMPRQKPKKEVGTLIIPAPTPVGFDFCFVMRGADGERVYKVNFSDNVQNIEVVEIFNCPPEYQPYGWWTGGQKAFGFYNKTALAHEAYWYNQNVYRVSYNNQIIKKVTWENIYAYYYSMFSLYKGIFYCVYQDGNDNMIRVCSLNEGIELIPVKEFQTDFSYHGRLIWKNFIVYTEVEKESFKIYDFIADKFVATIPQRQWGGVRLYLTNITNDYACFVFGFDHKYGDYPQHGIVLYADGTYQVFEFPGLFLNMSVSNEYVIAYYFPHVAYINNFYANLTQTPSGISFASNEDKIVASNGSAIIVSNDGKEWHKSYYFGAATMVFLSNGKLLIGDGQGTIYLSTNSELTDFTQIGYIDPEAPVSLQQIIILPDGTLIALVFDPTRAFRSTDNGETWNEVWDFFDPDIFQKITKLFYIGGIVIGLRGEDCSFDNGITWQELGAWIIYHKCIITGNLTCAYQNSGVTCRKDPSKICYFVPSVPCAIDEDCIYSLPRPANDSDGCLGFHTIGGNSYYYRIDPEKSYLSQTDGNLYYVQVLPDRSVVVDKILSNNFEAYSLPQPLPIILPSYQQNGVVYAEGEVILVSLEPNSFDDSGYLYRSTNGGNSWTLISSSTSQYFTQFYKYKDVIIGKLNYKSGLYLYQKIMYSEDNGSTWNDISYDTDFIIETYKKSGNTFQFLHQLNFETDDVQDEELRYVTDEPSEIGTTRTTQIYNDKFYFFRRIYDIKNNVLLSESEAERNDNIWLGKYRFYSLKPVLGGLRDFYVEDMETGETKLLSKEHTPFIYPEHLATYILR